MTYVREHLIEHIEKVYRYARALTHDVDASQDLAHEVCVRALRYEKSFKDNDAQHLQAWLLCITHNEFVNRSRRERIKRAHGVPKALGEHRVEAPQEFQVQVRELGEMLKRLPKEQRDIILAYALTSMDYAEMGKHFNVPSGTVRSRLSRAREELRRLDGA